MQQHRQNPSAGHDAQALQSSERARARALLEILSETGIDVRQGADPQMLERERSLQQKLNERAERQTRLSNGMRQKMKLPRCKRKSPLSRANIKTFKRRSVAVIHVMLN
jgi:hypothetical protein